MLHTKFRENWPTGSGEVDLFQGFYHIWAWRPSWSCDHHHISKFHFHVPKSVHTKFGSKWPSGF